MDLLGADYLLEGVIRAAKAERERYLYRMYVTDALSAMVENTAKLENRKTMSKRYVELAEPLANPRKRDNRTGDEIAADVIRRAGLKLV